MAAWRIGMRPRVIAGSVVLLGLTAAALSVAFAAGASSQAQSRELAQRLVPAAAASVDLLELYQDQQTWLRDYVTGGHPGPLVTFDGQAARIAAVENQIGALGRGDGLITRQLSATIAAHRAWLTDIADPQLAAVARADATQAQALQANTARVRPYVLAIRSAGAALQTQIAAKQQSVASSLTQSQGIAAGRAHRDVRRGRGHRGIRHGGGVVQHAAAVPGAASGHGLGRRRGLRHPDSRGRPA